MTNEALSMHDLEDQIRSLTVAESPAEVFKTLLEGARVAAPRATVFLVRRSELKGWGAIGYPSQAAEKQRAYVGPAGEGWLGQVLRSEQPLHSTEAPTATPGFGQPEPSECYGIAVRLKGRPIAVMVIERLAGELPWHPSVLGMLVRVAQLRLDLDLVQRKLAALGAARSSAPTTRPAPAAEPTPAAQTSAPAAVVAASSASVSPASVESTAVAVESPETMTASVAEVEAAAPEATDEDPTSNDPRLEAARRYARLVATDIRLYNEESVVLGRKEGDLATRLQESIARGKETFQRRHGELGPEGLRILHSAFTEVLAGGQADLIPASVLD
jgi:hypothetical protein